MKRFLLIVLAVLMIVGLAACGSSNKADSDWPGKGLGALIPKPDQGKIEITENDDDEFTANVEGVSKDFFDEYAEKCVKAGFNVDVEKDHDFEAFREDATKIEISYYESSEEMRIEIEAGEKLGDLKWPTNTFGEKVPKPESTYGVVKWQSSDGFCLYVGNTTIDDFNNYVDKCTESGFDIDFKRYEKSFNGKNADGDSLQISYEGANIIFIRIDAEEAAAPEDDVIATEKPDVKPTEVPKENKDEVSGSNKELKEFLKSYEAFIDEYCAFMKKYNDSDDVLGMLNDYTTYLNKYSDLCAKAEAWAGKDLSASDLKEYTEVMARCTKKLSEIY